MVLSKHKRPLKGAKDSNELWSRRHCLVFTNFLPFPIVNASLKKTLAAFSKCSFLMLLLFSWARCFAGLYSWNKTVHFLKSLLLFLFCHSLISLFFFWQNCMPLMFSEHHFDIHHHRRWLWFSVSTWSDSCAETSDGEPWGALQWNWRMPIKVYTRRRIDMEIPFKRVTGTSMSLNLNYPNGRQRFVHRKSKSRLDNAYFKLVRCVSYELFKSSTLICRATCTRSCWREPYDNSGLERVFWLKLATWSSFMVPRSSVIKDCANS